VRVGTAATLGIAVVVAAGAATARGWPEGLAELIQRTEDARTAATAWGARQAVGPSLEELAGDGAVRAARLHNAGPLGDPGSDRLGRARWFSLALLFPVAAQFLYRGGELNETAARRPEPVLLGLAAVALRLGRPETA